MTTEKKHIVVVKCEQILTQNQVPESYSSIHKAAVHRSASGWNCPRQSRGTVGNCEADGFVNSTVKPTCEFYPQCYALRHLDKGLELHLRRVSQL